MVLSFHFLFIGVPQPNSLSFNCLKIMKLSNIWKAWLSSLIGAFIPIFTGLLTSVINGTVDWTSVKISLAPALVLVFTDILKELQNEIKK
jgi:hypothetical protein